MKLIIHDLEISDFQKLFPDPLKDTEIISNDGIIHNCTGCFGCWVKTPAACVIRDNYGDMGELLSKCNELIIISKCCYGGFSPFIKNVLDRSISYILPNFVIRNKEMHHMRRYQNNINMRVYFYSNAMTKKEKQTAKKLVKANSINLYCNVTGITFVHDITELEAGII